MENIASENILELLLYGEEHRHLIHNALFRTLEDGYWFGPHCHKNVELCLMLDGECDIIINGENVTVHEHEFLILFSNVIHSFHVHKKGGCQFLQLHFSPMVFMNLNTRTYEEQRFIYYIATETRQFLKNYFTEEFLSCVERIEREVNSERDNHIALANLYIYELLLLLSREVEQVLTPSNDICHPAALKAIRYINEHLDEKLMLDEIAENCKVGKRYLTKIFQESFHVTVNNYINLARINQAMDELAKDDCNLTELSYRLGFSSVQYFTTVFKKYSGVTPKKYRTLNSI